ncbi:MAG TPA: CotH kinase family protein [Kofleriaceae bacterium]|nr:CotH kinase family protein [Kofleriaceae bacterium]
MSARRIGACLLLAAAAGCGAGDATDSGEMECANGENTAPATPTIRAPAPYTIDAVPDDVVIRTSAFADGDAEDHHVASEIEIWRWAGGEPVMLVWKAHREEPDALTQVALADGTFEVGSALEERAIYAVQARYRDAGSCSAWSEWSAPRTFRTDDGSRYWLGGTVRDIELDIPPASWDAIDAEAVPPDCVPFERSYHTGSVTLDGETFEGVGVRGKGGCGSARHLDGKAGFKISLEWDDPDVEGCPDEQRSHGLERFTLNNMVQDASFVHEHLAYALFRSVGVPAPRTTHVRLTVNGELWGLYNGVETVDRRMLWRWFDDDRGMLYEGTYWCDLVANNIPPDETDSTDYCISREFHPSECATPDPGADPETYEPVRGLVAALDALPDDDFYPAIEQVMEFDTFLSMWSVEALINHWDGYVGDIQNNYRIYHDPSSGRWTILPSGADQTFSDGSLAVSGLVASRCWNEEDCRAAYQARLAEVIDVFEQDDLSAMASSLRDKIADDVMADPRKETSFDGFSSSVDATIGFIQARPDQMRGQLPP